MSIRHSDPFARKPIATLLKEMEGGERLHRVLGPVALTSLGVGATIGTGIYVLTGEVAKNYLARLSLEKGAHRDIDENGDLMVRRAGKVERRPLVPALAVPSWLDPATGGPRR